MIIVGSFILSVNLSSVLYSFLKSSLSDAIIKRDAPFNLALYASFE